MKVCEIHFLQEAMDDLEEIVLYIAQDSRAAAIRMHEKIIGKVGDLATFPNRGRLIPDKKMSAAGYRVLGIKPYVVFYRVIDNNLFIYRILHGATNYPLLYEKLAHGD